MSLVLHLVKWDIKRFQILLSLWLLLAVAGGLHQGAWPAIAVALEARQTVSLAGYLLALVEVLFSIVLIALMVHEHPLVGTSAFWMTRPIPPRALLAAKLILLSGAMVAVPVVSEIAVMIVYGVPAATMAGVAAQTAFFRMLWLAAIMTFAAPTLNIAKFALAIGGLLIGTWAVLITVDAIRVDRFEAEPPIPPAQAMYDPTPQMIGAVLVIGAVLIFLVVLYDTRARGRSIAVAAAGVAIACGIGNLWAWPLLAPRRETPAWALDPSSLRLSAAPNTLSVRAGTDYGYYASPVWTIARAGLQLTNLPAGWSSAAAVREASIRAEGREALVSYLPGPGMSPRIEDSGRPQKNEVMRRLLNVTRLNDWSESPAETAIVMVARTGDIRQLAADQGAYEGRFLMPLRRHDVEAVLPFRVGSSFRLGAYQFVLDRIRVRQNRISILVRESGASSVFAREPLSNIEYYLRNPATSEAVQAAWRQLGGEMSLERFLPLMTGVGDPQHLGFRVLAVSLEFPTSYGRQAPIAFNDTWIERAELVIVRNTEAGIVERRLAIADFPIRTE